MLRENRGRCQRESETQCSAKSTPEQDVLRQSVKPLSRMRKKCCDRINRRRPPNKDETGRNSRGCKEGDERLFSLTATNQEKDYRVGQEGSKIPEPHD